MRRPCEITITALQRRARAEWAAGEDEPEDASAGTAIARAPTTAEAAMTGKGERRMRKAFRSVGTAVETR
jgi:hypothetical protein